jgi:hypothetical protein
MTVGGAARQSEPSPAPTVARSIIAATGSAAGSSPIGAQQTAAPDQAVAMFEPAATAVVQRVDGAAPPPPSERAAGHSDDELDELAGALFGRFRNRLRHEYIYEREAKGLTFDNN